MDGDASTEGGQDHPGIQDLLQSKEFKKAVRRLLDEDPAALLPAEFNCLWEQHEFKEIIRASVAEEDAPPIPGWVEPRLQKPRMTPCSGRSAVSQPPRLSVSSA